MRKASLIVATGALLGMFLGRAGAGERKPRKTSAKKSEVAATVLRLAGSVNFRRAKGARFQALTAKTPLYVEDQLKTGKKSAVELKLADGARITLGADSSMVLRKVRTPAEPDATLLDLGGGSLGATIDKPLAGRQRFEISTPVAVCGVRGTRLTVAHRNPRRGPRGANRGRTTVTLGIGKANVKCRNPIFAGRPGLNLGRNQMTVVTWQGFGKPKPVPVNKRHLRRLMGMLPGWVPDPADPNLLRPLVRPGGPGVLKPGIGGRPGRPGVSGGTGDAYGRGPGGFSGATGRTILGSVGLTRGTPMGGLAGGGAGGGGGGGGDGGGGGAAGGDPVVTVLVTPGQPTQPPPPPPQPGPGPEPTSP